MKKFLGSANGAINVYYEKYCNVDNIIIKEGDQCIEIDKKFLLKALSKAVFKCDHCGEEFAPIAKFPNYCNQYLCHNCYSNLKYTEEMVQKVIDTPEEKISYLFKICIYNLLIEANIIKRIGDPFPPYNCRRIIDYERATEAVAIKILDLTPSSQYYKLKEEDRVSIYLEIARKSIQSFPKANEPMPQKYW